MTKLCLLITKGNLNWKLMGVSGQTIKSTLTTHHTPMKG